MQRKKKNNPIELLKATCRCGNFDFIVISITFGSHGGLHKPWPPPELFTIGPIRAGRSLAAGSEGDG